MKNYLKDLFDIKKELKEFNDTEIIVEKELVKENKLITIIFTEFKRGGD
jgi:hypothetical protein